MSELLNLRKDYFTPDPWAVILENFDPSISRATESVFSLANGFLAVRGYFDEGYSGDTKIGSYVNGVFHKKVLRPFWCKGLAHKECYIMPAINWLHTRVTLDGELLDLSVSSFNNLKIALDMKTGVLSREFIWNLISGKRLKVRFLRFLSMDTPNVGCQRIEFEPINFNGVISIRAGLDFSDNFEHTGENHWTCSQEDINGNTVSVLASTDCGTMHVFSKLRLNLPEATELQKKQDDKFVGFEFEVSLTESEMVTIDRIVAQQAFFGSEADCSDIWEQGNSAYDNEYADLSFNNLLEKQRDYWSDYWNRSDITIEGNIDDQQGIRYSLFNLHQTLRGAKGTGNLLTEMNDGQITWFTETHMLHYYLFNDPLAARKLLQFRYDNLPQAKERAREVDCIGASYPLATIDGTESCTWWEHSMLQIHVNAAIAYGIWHYVNVTGDKDFLYTQGIEMLIEISRFYASRGAYSQLNGDFGFYGVMGPDELHMMVSNNYYTNIIAKKTFEYTAQVLSEMQTDAHEKLINVTEQSGIVRAEIDDFLEKAEKMRIPLEKETGIFEQHEGFFGLPRIDVSNIPCDELPVKNNWAYDRIFRYAMINQPDVLLHMFLYGADYSMDSKRVNYEFYEPKCCHNSSLSRSVHAVLAAELGKSDDVAKYMNFAVGFDMDDHNRNVSEGLNVEAAGSMWLCIVCGFGGLRTDGLIPILNPSIPEEWNSYSFNIQIMGSLIAVKVDQNSVTIKLLSGARIKVIVFEKEYLVDSNGINIEKGR